MRILLINKDFCKICGGTGKYIWNTGNLLRKKGHEVFFFANSRKPYFEENPLYDKYFPEWIDTNKVLSNGRVWDLYKLLYYHNAENLLDDYIKVIKPDIIHINCVHYNISPSVIKSCLKSGVPFLMTVHESSIVCPSALLMKHGKTVCENVLCASHSPLHCLYNKCWNDSYLKSAFAVFEHYFKRVHRLYYKIPHFITPSNTLQQILLKAGFEKNKITHIDNYISDEQLKIQPEYKNNGYFLYVGRLVKEKGVQHILEAAANLRECKFHIVGNGPYEAKLRQYSKSLHLKNVEFLGYLNGLQLQEQYKNCTASIVPSVCFETFGLTAIEGMAYGKPVVGSRIGGIAEIIDNGINGFLFESGNIDEMVKNIEKIANSPNLTENLGQNARIKVEKRYTAETHYDKLLQTYACVMSGEN